MLLTFCLLAMVFFFVAVFLLRKKRYVRAIFKSPIVGFHVEFEADDEKRDPKP